MREAPKMNLRAASCVDLGFVRCQSWNGNESAGKERVVPRRSWDGSYQLDECPGVYASEMGQQQQLPWTSWLGCHGGAERCPQTETFGGAEGESSSLKASLLPICEEEHEQSISGPLGTAGRGRALELAGEVAITPVSEEMGAVVPQRSWDGSRQLSEFLGVNTLGMVTGNATEVHVDYRQQQSPFSGSRLGPHGGVEQRFPQTETYGGAEDGSLRASLLREPERLFEQSPSQAAVIVGSGSALDLTTGTAIIAMSEDMEQRNMTERAHEDSQVEEIKGHLKFSYFATGIAGAGIVSIYTGFLDNQTVDDPRIYIKVCMVLMIAAFTAGASLILLTFPCLCARAPIQIIRWLKYTTLAYLTLAVLDICIMFLGKIIVLAILLAFLPIFLLEMSKLVLGLCQD